MPTDKTSRSTGDEPDYDGILRVLDFTDKRVGSGKSTGLRWTDGSPTISPAEHEALEAMTDEAHERYDLSEYDHGDVLAHIWTNDEREVTQVVWL